MFSLGVDIGGTKIAAGIIDEKGACIERIELPSITNSSEEMFNQVKKSIELVLNNGNYKFEELNGIGIGVPGKVDYQNGIAIFQNNLPWVDFPLVSKLKESFPTTILLDNDVYMATYGEWYSSGKNCTETLVYITISTGISCCTIHNSQYIRGAGFAGEIGLFVVEDNPLPSKYVNDGCLEAVAAGPAIAFYTNAKRKLTSETKELTTKDVIHAFFSGEPFAVEVLQPVFTYIAKAIHSITCLLDPNKLILGGGVINNNPEILKHILFELDKILVPEQKGILSRIYPSSLKGDAGLIGAGLRIFEVTKTGGMPYFL